LNKGIETDWVLIRTNRVGEKGGELRLTVRQISVDMLRDSLVVDKSLLTENVLIIHDVEKSWEGELLGGGWSRSE
jgi:hypothetical protein